MLQVALTPHRTALQAGIPTQKLWALLTLLPSIEAARLRPQLHLAVVVDTSGSMHEPAPGAQIEITPTTPLVTDGKTYTHSFRGLRKLDLAMAAARTVVDSPLLRPDDWLAIIQFDTEAQLLAAGLTGEARDQLLTGVAQFEQFRGQTRMDLGLECAVAALEREEATARKVLLVTDGRTTHEAGCHRAADALLELQAPVVALGVGEDYNEDLLAEIANRTRGKPWDLRDMTTLPAIFEAELGGATRQVIRDVELQLKLVQGVTAVALTRVYPSLAEIDVAQDRLKLGTLESGDYTIFLLELDVPQRAPVRSRLAQASLSYRVAADRATMTSGPHDLVIDITADQERAADVDPEVMAYVQQRNVDRLIQAATAQSARHPEAAAGTLAEARTMAERVGNTGITVALTAAEAELRTTGRITPATTRTIKLGARTQTVRAGQVTTTIAGVPDPATIRRLSGA